MEAGDKLEVYSLIVFHVGVDWSFGFTGSLVGVV